MKEENDDVKSSLENEFGIQNAKLLFGPKAASDLIDIWSGIDQTFAKDICNYSYGSIYSRKVLPTKTRELCAVMTLTAMDKQSALAFHVKASLRSGSSVEEVQEAILQAHLYAGIPCVMNALKTLNKILEEEEFNLKSI
ncbi:MAG: hypothetical protein CENE_01154 [Candidatus Celerinatantimonas neptuna]|nr:MAG: hypothetical protein CENE_01154 [Candidatus Celerinatantimonas neptuna]